jgi:iron(III) transport system permease protein
MSVEEAGLSLPTAGVRAAPRLPRIRVSRQTVYGLLLLAVVAVFTVLPVGFVLVGSFNTAGTGERWTWGVSAWYQAFTTPRTVQAIGLSFVLALRAPIAVVIGFFMSWLLVRVRIPGRSFIEFALWASFFLPGLPIAIGWILLLDPKFGLINELLKGLPFVHGPVFNVYSVAGILWVQLTLTTIPVMVILLTPALRQLDSSFEQSARMSGAGHLQIMRRIVVPLLGPALLTALVAGLIRGLEAFEIEQLLGIPAGIYVYATRIYDLMNVQPPLFPQAMALSTFFLLVLFALAFVYQVYTQRRTFVTLTGRGVMFNATYTGRWRYAASALCLVYLSVSLVLPLCLLVLGSFMRLFGFFNVPDPYTTEQWLKVFHDPVFLLALRNSIFLGASVSILGLLVYGLLAYAITRSRLSGRRTLSLLVWMPWAVPGVLLGVALLWLMLTVPVLTLFYGTMGALVLALLIQNMPFGVQLLRTALGQVSTELEEAARMSGASWLATYRLIILPLMAPMLVSVGVLTFVVVLRDISTSVLLAGPSTRPLSLLMLEFARGSSMEAATVVGLLLSALAIVVALLARRLGLQFRAGGA